jgi:hypothetical protein
VSLSVIFLPPRLLAPMSIEGLKRLANLVHYMLSRCLLFGHRYKLGKPREAEQCYMWFSPQFC